MEKKGEKMSLVLWFLKKNMTYMGKKDDNILMSAIPYDRTPLGYKGVEVFVKEDLLNNGLTEDFLRTIEEEK